MSDLNQVKDMIKEELKKLHPSPKKIISALFKLKIDKEGVEFSPKDEWRYIPDVEFFRMVGVIFNADPKFYMRYLYKGIKKKMRKLNGYDKLKEMEKFIIEAYCLYPEEEILLEVNGGIQFFENPKLKSRGVTSSGTLYLTNNRIIVCPLLGQGLIPMGGSTSTGFSSRNRIRDYSLKENCYGYIFPIQNLSKLKKRSETTLLKIMKVSYNVEVVGSIHRYKNVTILIGKSPDQEEIVKKLIELLSEHSKEEVTYPM